MKLGKIFWLSEGVPCNGLRASPMKRRENKSSHIFGDLGRGSFLENFADVTDRKSVV